MRLLPSLLFCALAAGHSLYAATTAGVTLPDTVQVGGKALVLNGLGVRSEFMVKVYVAGAYLEQKASDPDAIIKSDAPKQITMHFLHNATKKQMTDAFAESFKDNTPDAEKTMKPEIDQLLGGIDAVKVGDEMVFTYVPGTGTTMTLNSKGITLIKTPAFRQVIFAVWFGPKPPTASLKKAMLGQ